LPIRAALTFDAEHADRPNAGETERLLAVLAAGGTRATFFLQGRWVEATPSVARSVVEGGHVIGSHGHYHCRMSQLTDDGIRDDVARSHAAIRDVVGVDPRPWFRCPFGDGASDPRVLAGLEARGYRHVGWHVDGEDWQDTCTPEALASTVLDGIRGAGNGAVVLLHAWPAATPEAVRLVLEASSRDGIAFVGIDELGAPPVATVPW
jgi:peptidoglycan-N-acetylglucosamine deacetylase